MASLRRRYITEDLLRASRFCFMASAECDHPSVDVGRGLVPCRLLQTQPVLYSPWGAVFTFNAVQTTKSGPPGDLGFIPFEFKPLSNSLVLQWDITGSTAWGARVVYENGWLKCSCALVKTAPWTVWAQLTQKSKLELMDIYFHILSKATTLIQPLFCAVWSTAHTLSRLLSSSWLCSFVCCPLSYACALYLSKCLLCPLSHVHLLGLIKSVLSVGVSCEEERWQFASSATNYWSWTQTRPRGSAAKWLSIYLKWLPLLYRSEAQTSVALAQPKLQYKKN